MAVRRVRTVENGSRRMIEAFEAPAYAASWAWAPPGGSRWPWNGSSQVGGDNACPKARSGFLGVLEVRWVHTLLAVPRDRVLDERGKTATCTHALSPEPGLERQDAEL
jgi:hypothetical protein